MYVFTFSEGGWRLTAELTVPSRVVGVTNAGSPSPSTGTQSFVGVPRDDNRLGASNKESTTDRTGAVSVFTKAQWWLGLDIRGGETGGTRH